MRAILSTSSAKRGANSSTIFQKNFSIFEFFNHAYHFQISKYLDNSRKLIWRNKESKFLHFQNLIKENPCQPKTFEVVLNRARGINRIIIRLV